MAMSNCPECGKEISDKANSCPSCGYPIKSKIESNTTLTQKQMEKIVKDSEKRAYNDKTKKSISSCIVWIIIAFLIFILISYCSVNFSSL